MLSPAVSEDAYGWIAGLSIVEKGSKLANEQFT